MRVAADTLALRRWLGAAPEPTAVLVACREHENLDAWRTACDDEPQVVYRLEGCLADAPPAAILEVLAGGAVGVSGLLDGCADPPAARRVLIRAAKIAAAVGVVRPVLALGAPPLGDRATGAGHEHRRWRRRAATAPLLAVLDACAMPVSRRALVGLEGALGDLEEHPGIRLYSVVRELLAGAAVPAALAGIATGAAQLEAAQCCGNGVCVLACPTQALTLTVTDLAHHRRSTSAPDPAEQSAVVGAAAFSNDRLQQFALSVDPALCIDCGKCVELCPEGALSRVRPLPWAQALNGMSATLRVGVVRRCSRCGMPNQIPGSLCGVCAFRMSEPFGSELPLGFSRKVRS